MQRIFDSHIHFWDPDALTYPWLADRAALNRAYLPADLPKAGAGWHMEKLVFVQADCVPEQGWREAAWVAALDDERIAAIVAFAPLEQGDAVRPHLEQLAAIEKVKGVRRLIQSEPPGFSLQPDFIRGVQALADYHFTFDICVTHDQLPDVIQLLKQVPDADCVLDHCGKPDIASGEIEHWREHIAQLAALDNVVQCKLSGLVTEADHANWTIDDLRPYVAHVLESFDADRVLFGGDWPVVRLAADYDRWVQTALQLTADLSDDEKQAIFYRNASDFYVGA